MYLSIPRFLSAKMLLHVLFTSLALALLTFASQGFSPDPSAILSIQHTIAQYPLAIDSKDFSKLSAVFTQDAFANYSIAAPIMNGLPAIESTLQAVLVNFTTQHSLTTQSVNVPNNGHAEATTYVIATMFGIDGTLFEGQLVSAYANYMDKLRVDQGTWKIYHRQVVIMVGLHF
jgi:ketosteroid isomerase-like protein